MLLLEDCLIIHDRILTGHCSQGTSNPQQNRTCPRPSLGVCLPSSRQGILAAPIAVVHRCLLWSADPDRDFRWSHSWCTIYVHDNCCAFDASARLIVVGSLLSILPSSSHYPSEPHCRPTVTMTHAPSLRPLPAPDRIRIADKLTYRSLLVAQQLQTVSFYVCPLKVPSPSWPRTFEDRGPWKR